MRKQVILSKQETSASEHVAKKSPVTKGQITDNRPSSVFQKKQIETMSLKPDTKESGFGQSSASPVQMVRAAPGMVTGITHLVKINGKSIYRGTETIQLEHGQVVIVDTDQRLRSRRGPNQEHFRAEDHQRGTHIYRWFRVIRIGERDVAPGTFIREDAFTFHLPHEEPERLHPNTAPSLDTQPGADPIEHHRTPEARSLDRLARGHWIPMLNTIRQSEQPPHIAMTVLGNRVHAMGNTGERPIPADWDAARRFGELMGSDTHLGRGDEQRRKRAKLRNKLVAHARGQYHPTGVTDPHTMNAIGHAIARPDHIHWGNSADPRKMHGEMHLQETILGGLHRRDIRLPRTRIQQQHISGVMLDCMFCHWAHAIFNQVIGRHHGVEITTGGTHSGIPNEWQAPQWLYQNDRAWAMFKAKLAAERIDATADDHGMVRLRKKASTKGMGLPQHGSDSEDEHFR